MFESIVSYGMRMILGSTRSPLWTATRDRFMKGRDCSACGSDRALEAHHKTPVHVWPEGELQEENLVALCRDCHFTFGHLKDWSSWNVNVDKDCAEFLKKVESRP